jgi:hypothetical protein
LGVSTSTSIDLSFTKYFLVHGGLSTINGTSGRLAPSD